MWLLLQAYKQRSFTNSTIFVVGLILDNHINTSGGTIVSSQSQLQAEEPEPISEQSVNLASEITSQSFSSELFQWVPL